MRTRTISFVLACSLFLICLLFGCTSGNSAPISTKPHGIDVVFIIDYSGSFVNTLEKQRLTNPMKYDNVMHVIAILGENLEEPDDVTISFDEMSNTTTRDESWQRRKYVGVETLIGYVRKNVIGKAASTVPGTNFTPAFQEIDRFAAEHPDRYIVPVILSDQGVDDIGTPERDAALTAAITATSKRSNILCIGALLAHGSQLKTAMAKWLSPYGSRAVVSDDTVQGYTAGINELGKLLKL